MAGATGVQQGINTLAMGYVFGGWNFGPEGALYDYYQGVFADDENPKTNSDAYIKQYIKSKYGIGSTGAQISVPALPDWDLSMWCTEQDIDDKGLYPNDYIQTFISTNAATGADPSIVAGSYSQLVNPDGTTTGGGTPARLQNFTNMANSTNVSKVNFHYISKKIKFNRGTNPWLVDYKVELDLVNCLGENYRGSYGSSQAGSYFGHWVEKGYDEFTIYVAFIADDNNNKKGTYIPRFPAPHSLTTTSGRKKKKTTSTITLSDRDGERFSGFVVPVGDILYSNTAELAGGAGSYGGYVGNPRIGKCTYPTVMWTITGVPLAAAPYLYGNLNKTNPTITIKS